MSKDDAEKSPLETTPQPHAPPVLPSDIAPNIFVDGMEGFAYNGEVVKMNAIEDVIFRAIGGQTIIHRRTSAHLVMSIGVLEQIHRWLGDNLAGLHEHLANKRQREPSPPSSSSQTGQ